MDGFAVLGACAQGPEAVKGKELAVICEHLSWTGGEGAVDEIGRFPVLWICDSCGTADILIARFL